MTLTAKEFVVTKNDKFYLSHAIFEYDQVYYLSNKRQRNVTFQEDIWFLECGEGVSF